MGPNGVRLDRAPFDVSLEDRANRCQRRVRAGPLVRHAEIVQVTLDRRVRATAERTTHANVVTVEQVDQLEPRRRQSLRGAPARRTIGDLAQLVEQVEQPLMFSVSDLATLESAAADIRGTSVDGRSFTTDGPRGRACRLGLHAHRSSQAECWVGPCMSTPFSMMLLCFFRSGPVL
jgi:hypothetical protein